MRSIFRFLFSYPAKVVYFVLLLCATLYWALNGWNFCETASQNKAEKTVAELTEKVRQKSPVLAVELEKLQHEYNIHALAATLKEREKLDSVKGLTVLAEQVRAKRSVYDLQLAQMAVQPQYVPVAMRKDFLDVHGTFLQQINFFRQYNDTNLQVGIDSETAKYLQFLEDAKKQPDVWRKAADNPMFVFLATHEVQDDLLTFYDKEKNWLDDVLFLLITSADDDSAMLDLNEILSVIEKHHREFRDAAAIMGQQLSQDEDAAVGLILLFNLFHNYGDVISTCVKNKIPLDELLNAMLANSDFCEQYENDLSARLIKIQSEQPDVWKNADMPMVLQLSQDVPQLANDLCKKYASHDIAAFLYLKYDGYVPQAAAAIDKFGDLAVIILNQYAESDLFKNLLKDTELGVRIIPYVAKYDDKGLEQLDQNKNWLDKCFDKDGNPKEEEWWTILPGGALVKVCQNMSKGYPNEWSELGWAGLDVADATLLMVSLGASAPASTAVKGGTTTVKVGGKTIARETAIAMTKSGERKLLSGATRAGEGLSVLARLTHLAKNKQIVRWTFSGGKVIYRVYEVGVKTPLRVFGQSVYKTANVISNPMVARTLLTVGIAITVLYRTIPGLPDAMKQLGEKAGQAMAQSAKATAETVPATLCGFLEEFADSVASRYIPYFVFFGTLIVFFGLTFSLGRRLLLKPART
jgi:hypothetical protein